MLIEIEVTKLYQIVIEIRYYDYLVIFVYNS